MALSGNLNNDLSKEVKIIVNSDTAKVKELAELYEQSEQKASSLQRELEQVNRLLNEQYRIVEELRASTGFDAMAEDIERYEQTARKAASEVKAWMRTMHLDDDSIMYSDDTIKILNNVKSGLTTVGEAISQLKVKYRDLISTTNGSGGIIDAQQIELAIAKLDTVETSVTKLLTIITDLVQNGVKVSGELSQASGNATNSMQGAVEAISKLGTSANESYEPMRQLVEALSKFATTDTTKLMGIANTFANIANITHGQFGEKSANGIINLLTRLDGLSKTTGGSIRFDIKGFENLSGLKVSRAALENLANYLPIITSNVDISKLQALAAIDWTNLQGLKVNKATVDNIVNLAEFSKILDEVKHKVDEYAKSQERAADAAKKNPLNGGGKNGSGGGNPPGGNPPGGNPPGGNPPGGNNYGELVRQVIDYNTATGQAVGQTSVYRNALTGLFTTVSEVVNENGQLVEVANRTSQTYDTAAQSLQRYADAELNAEKVLTEISGQQNILIKAGDDQSNTYQNLNKALDDYIRRVNQLNTAYQNSAQRPQDQERYKLGMTQLRAEFEGTKRSIAGYSTAQKQAADAARENAAQVRLEANVTSQYTNLSNKLADSIRNYTTAQNSSKSSSRDAYQNLQLLQTELNKLNTDYGKNKIGADEFANEIKRIRTEMSQNVQVIKNNGDATRTWGERLSGLAQKFSYWFSASQAIMQTIRAIRQMVTNARELDDAMTQLKIVTDETDSSYAKFSENVADTAQRIGASITDLIDATTTYARLGYKLEESSLLAELTGKLQMTGGIEAEDAQNAVTAILKAFDGVDISNMELVMDKLVDVGNNFPISVSQIAEGMNNASSALSAAGNSFEQSVALLTAANTTIQNASRSSTGLRTIAARIRNSKTELEELGEEVLTTAKYDEMVKTLTSNGVSLMENNQLRSTYDIIKDIAAVWKDMETNQKAALAQTLAGTRQQDVFYSLINQFQEASGAMKKMEDSAGTLEKSYGIYMESISAHITKFKDAFAKLGSDTMTGDFLKTIIDAGTGVVNLLDKIMKLVNAIGGLKTVLFGLAGAIALIKAESIGLAIERFIGRLGGVLGVFSKLHQFIYNYFRRSYADLMASTQGATAGMSKFAVSLKNAGIAASTAQIAITAAFAAITIGIAIYNKWKQAQEEARQKAYETADAAQKEAESIVSSYTAFKESFKALRNHTGTKEEFQTATDTLCSSLDIEKTKLLELAEEYGTLDEAIQTVIRDKLTLSITEMNAGITKAEEEFLNFSKNVGGTDWITFSDEDGFFMENRPFKEYLESLGHEFQELTTVDGSSLGWFLDFDVSTIEGALDAYEYVGELLDDLQNGVNEGKFSSEDLVDSEMFKTLSDISTKGADFYKKIIGYIDGINQAQAQLRADEWFEDAKIPETEAEYEAFVDTIAQSESEFGGYWGRLEDIKNAIEAILKERPELKDFWDKFNEEIAAAAGEGQPEEKISFSDLFIDSEGKETDFKNVVDRYVKMLDTLQEAKDKLLFDKDVDRKSVFNDLVKDFPELSTEFDNLEGAIDDLMNGIKNGDTGSVVAWFNGQMDKLATDEDRAKLEAWAKSIFNAYDIFSESGGLSFNELLTGKSDKASLFQSSMSDYFSKMKTLREALDTLRFDKSATPDTVIKDLIDEFPELAGEADNLEEAIESLMAALTGEGTKHMAGAVQEATGAYEILEEAIAACATDEDRERLMEWFKLMTEGDTDLEITTKHVDSFSESVKSITDILNAQTTASVVSPEDFKLLTEYSSALEYHNGTLRYNAEAVGEIVKAKAEEEKALIAVGKAQTQSRYLENAKKIQDARRKSISATASEKETLDRSIKAWLSENATLANNCKQYSLMTNAIDQATSAYQNWLNAQNASQSGEMFDGAISALKKINDTLNVSASDDYGRVGNADYKAALQFVIPDSVDRKDEAAINSYIDSIKQYFTFDDKGEFDGLNITQFCQKAVEAGLMYMNEAGDDFIIAGEKTMEDFAEGLGLSLPLVQAMFGEMEEFGGEFKWLDKNGKSLQDLAVDANEAAEALGNFSENSNLKLILDVSDYSDARIAINTLEGNIEQMKNLKATVGVDDTQVQHANAVIEYCVRQKQELSKPLIMDVDASQVPNEIGGAIELVQEFQQAYNDLELNKELEVDTTDAQAKVDELAEQVQGLDADVLAELGIDPTSTESIISSIANIDAEMLVKAGVDESLIKKYKAPEKEATIKYNVDDSAVRRFLLTDLDRKAWVEYGIKDDEVQNYNPKDINRTITYNVRKVDNGINYDAISLNGTAHAGGNWGTATGGRTLVGELGREIVVDGRTGRWYTVGDRGAEFVNIPKHAIVFNHKQTESLLNNGYIFGRGNAMLEGSARVDNPVVTGHIKARDAARSVNDNSNAYDAAAAAANAATDAAYAAADAANSTAEAATEEKTALEKFQDWFSMLFDWIEVRLERQTDKISRYISNAESFLDSGRYTASANNYVKAIGETAIQASNEQAGAKRYYEQAKAVMQKAVENGILSQDTAERAMTRVANGEIDIHEYNEDLREVINDYKQWYDKMVECDNALLELDNNVKSYVRSLKELRDAQRDATLASIDTTLGVATGGIVNASGTSSVLSNSQLAYTNAKLQGRNKAYTTAVSNNWNDMNRLRRTAKAVSKTQYNGSTNEKYKAALKRAISNINNQKPVSNSDLDLIRTVSAPTYERLLAYNTAFENLEIAREEQAVEYAANSSSIYENIAKIYANKDTETDNRLNFYKTHSDNVHATSNKNKYLKLAASQYDTILKNDQAEINKYSSTINSKSKTILKSNSSSTLAGLGNASASTRKNVNRAIDDAQKDARSGKPISASTLGALLNYYKKGYISTAFYKACIDYNNALELRTEAKAQLAIDRETAKAEKASIGSQMVSNIERDYTNKLNANKDKTTEIETAQKMKTTRGLSLTKGSYEALIRQSAKDESYYLKEANAVYKQIQKNLKSGYWSTSSQEYKDAIQAYNSYKNKANECKISQEEWNNAIAELPFTNIEKAIQLLDAIADYNESDRKLKQAMSQDLSKQDYNTAIKDNRNKISKYQKEQELAYENYLKALSNKDKVYGGKTADEWRERYLSIGKTINDLQVDVEKLKDALRDDVYWRTYERAHESAERLKNVLDGISKLMDEDMYFDKNGKMTRYGVTQVATLVKQYENARVEVQNYSKDIAHLNKMYADGWYTEEEYKDKLGDLQKSLLDAAADVKSVTDSIIDMYKTMAQTELDALFKIIDARSEALQKKKEYYDYDKTIKSQSKDVQSLQAQLAALEGINDAASKAKRAQLQAQLQTAQESLKETIDNHITDLSKTALDELKTTMQDAFDDRWKYLETHLTEVTKLLAAANTLAESSVSVTKETYNSLLKFYGAGETGRKEVINASFASGTPGVRKKMRALVGENGDEIVTTEKGLILTLNKGNGVIPAKMTDNLMRMAQGISPLDAIKVPSVSSAVGSAAGMQIVQHYDSLINIEGSADAATVADLKRMSAELLESSYNYTSQRLYRGYVKAGGKRAV